MSIVVTGAAGHLGSLAVHALLDRGVPASDIVATARDTARLAACEALGVTVRRADFTNPASLKDAFVGSDTLLLVSSSEVGQRVSQHQNAIDAARDAGVDLVAYTSIAHADSAAMLLATEHVATERLLAESGLPHVLLRNSWYVESYTEQIAAALQAEAVLGAAKDGRISAAARADYADAAARVLTEDGHAGMTYELGGDEAFTMTEYAAALAALSGQPVAYHDLEPEEYAAALVGFGVPQPFAGILADSDAGIARGELHVQTGELSRLIGRPTTTMKDAIAAALRGTGLQAG